MLYLWEKEDQMRKRLTWLIVMVFSLASWVLANPTTTTTANGNSVSLEISKQIDNWACPVIKFAAGPISWLIIGGVLLLGVILLAVGGRNATRYMLTALAAGLLLGIAKVYIGAASGNTFVTGCLG